MMVDPERRRIRVQPGAVWADVDAATQVHGLATPAGVVSRTGVAGLTVGGGFGWLSRRWGLTSDNVVSMEMLLADGERVHVSPTSTPTCSGRRAAAAATSGSSPAFEFALHELGTEVLAGPLLYPADQAREVLPPYREVVAASPDELSCTPSRAPRPRSSGCPPDCAEPTC